MFPEVMEIMQKSCKQDPASQRRKEVMFSMKIQYSLFQEIFLLLSGLTKMAGFR